MFIRRLYGTAVHPAKFQLPPTIRQLLSPSAQERTTTSVTGWIKSIRKQKNVTFAVVSDGTTTEGLQAVVLNQKGTSPEVLKRLTNGTAVRLMGNLVRSPGRGQQWELVVQEGDKGAIEVLGDCDIDTYPIQKKSLSTEYLRDNAYLRARTGQIAAMLRLRDSVSREISDFFKSQGFIYTHTPIITGSDCEGAGEAFRIAPILPDNNNPNSNSPTIPSPFEFFSRPAYLTVSHQLHLESLSSALSRVYTLSPCFRAERSMTSRHLAEFWMLEAEWNLATRNDSMEEICAFTEGLIRKSVDLESQDVLALWKDKEGRQDSEAYRTLRTAFDKPEAWGRMTYTEAIKVLDTEHAHGQKFEFKPTWGESLSSEHERWLAEVHVGGPLFVTNYPAGLKPFYMRANDDGKTVACFDLIVPRVGELVGGSVREERWDMLKGRMEELGLLSFEPDEKDDTTLSDSTYKWYMDLRKYGGAPHGGFGLGFERLISWVGGIDSVRECIGMPRWTGRMIM